MLPVFNAHPSQHAVPIMMNQSGQALAIAVQPWRMGLQDILLVCDDVNLPLETLRLRPQGSDGGHHGLASCLEQLQSQAIPRLRVGVGIRPLPKDLTDFVLSPFTKQERLVLDHALNRAVEACELWAVEGMQVAMNRVNPVPRAKARGFGESPFGDSPSSPHLSAGLPWYGVNVRTP
jgi:aminoacyl-tRNA hydrolase